MLVQIDKGTTIIILLLLIERERGNKICLAYWKKCTKPKMQMHGLYQSLKLKKKNEEIKSLYRSFIGYNIVIIGYITIMISTKYTIETKRKLKITK